VPSLNKKQRTLFSSSEYCVTSRVVSMNGSDSSRRNNCDTADGSSCETVNCVTVSASGINSLDPKTA
jgi:hypothetical protein